MTLFKIFILFLFITPNLVFAKSKNKFYSGISAVYSDLRLEIDPPVSDPVSSRVGGVAVKMGAVLGSIFEMNIRGIYNSSETLGILFAEQQNLFSKSLSRKETFQFGIGFNYLSIHSDEPYSFNRVAGAGLILKYLPSKAWIFQASTGPMANSRDIAGSNWFYRTGISSKVSDKGPWWVSVEGYFLNFFSGTNGNRTTWRTVSAIITYGTP